MTEKELCLHAVKAREKAYCVYSGFAVGAALLTASGKVYLGCNVENVSYPAGICAERTALFKAVSEGERSFAAICIAGEKKGKSLQELCMPCGICRQALSEFCSPDFPVLVVKNINEYEKFTLGKLLPGAFSMNGEEK